MAENMRFYDAARQVPAEAIKPIVGGRLKGMSNINAMWRIKKLTEMFGPCGIGWKYKTVEKWLYESQDGVVVQNVMIHLFVKVDGEWSEPIEGVGGAQLVAVEKAGKYTDDEAMKKATTDALSVACKLLGIGADVYFKEDSSKYPTRPQQPTGAAMPPPQPKQPQQKPAHAPKQPAAQDPQKPKPHLPAGVKQHDGPVDDDTLRCLREELLRTGYGIGPVMEYAKVKSEHEIPQNVALRYLWKMSTMPDYVVGDVELPFDEPPKKPVGKMFEI